MISKIIIMQRQTHFVLLFLFITAVPILHAQPDSTTVKTTLTAKQYSITSIDRNIDAEMQKNESQLSFQIFTGSLELIDAQQILNRIQEGLIEVKGIRFFPDRAVVLSSRRLSIPFQIENPSADGRLETILSFSANNQLNAFNTSLSLYEGWHSVVEINHKRGEPVSGKLLKNKNAVTAERLTFDPFTAPGKFALVHIPLKESGEEYKKSFLYRNRYWMVASASLVTGGAAAFLLGSDSSPAYLPEPPGRPAFNQ